MQLTTTSITKTFAGVHALQDVNIRVDQGEIVGLIGPNGSGKTTLINVISGVMPASSGRVALGEGSWEYRPAYRVARSGIARTFQTIRLFEEMTVAENVEVAAVCSPRTGGWGSRPRTAARRALDLLGLGVQANSMVGELSYGQQRRVEIARAIAGEPQFLLLDEPAAGLNEAESDELLDTLRRLREHLGCGMLLIDHDLRLIMSGTERIYVLNEGQLLAEGSPSEIRNNPDVIRAYLGDEVSTEETAGSTISENIDQNGD